ncbi:DNA polymerase I [Frisingicoccus sp.]|uniref:DNA polymerase I n=1 Tax=Frisingicoccus sp. TaxID=1918627 RepID=UPI003AB313F1
MNKKVVLIDGHSILNRAFYGVPVLTNSEGLHTNGIYGFLNIMFKVLDEEQAGGLMVAFDLKAPTFRHKMYEAYKGTRKPMPPELHEQVPVLKDVLQSMGIPIVTKEGYEADDILGTLSRVWEERGYDVAIISGDRDLLQLATKKVKISIPKTKAGGTQVENYYAEDVLAAYQVTPTQFIDLKALMGDTSDNIPGVPGIGEKTATKIITAYGSIESAYEHADEIKPARAANNLKEHYDMAVMSKKLATIDTHAPISIPDELAGLEHMYSEDAYQMMKRLEFKNILSRFNQEEVAVPVLSAAIEIRDENEQRRKVFEAMSRRMISLYPICQDDIYGLVLAYGEEAFWMPAESEEALKDMAGWFDGHPEMAVLGLKAGLHYFPLAESNNILDVSLMAYLLNPLKDSYDYDDIGRDYLGLTLPSRADLYGKKKLSEILSEDKKKAMTWLGYYAALPLKAADILKDELVKEGMWTLYQEVELPLSFSLYRMERKGIRVKREALKDYGEHLVGRIQELEQEIYALAGESFNILSPKQLGVILFEKLHLPYGKKTKTGYSTSAAVLEKLQDEEPIARLVLEYRQLTKLKSTYADGLANFISEDGRIHGKFHQTITATGRISSTEPNLQNIPVRVELGRRIRKVFVPREGCVFVDADYSQIELRVLAHMSGDENLIEAYKQAEDIHRMTASQVFHTPLEEVTSQQRSNAKAVNFGIIYGISSFGLSQGLSITRKEAEVYIKQYFAAYPKIKAFLDSLVAEGKEKGCVYTLFHRKRPIPELFSSNFMQRSFGERVAMNSPIQGTAADIIKIAMIRVDRRLREEGLKSRLVLQIHDELLIEAEADEAERVKQILREEMSHAAELKVPLEIDVNTGTDWYEAK